MRPLLIVRPVTAVSAFADALLGDYNPAAAWPSSFCAAAARFLSTSPRIPVRRADHDRRSSADLRLEGHFTIPAAEGAITSEPPLREERSAPQ